MSTPRYTRVMYQRYTVHERALYFKPTFFCYSYEACFKGEIVLPVRSPIIPQTGGLCNQRKQLYLPTDPTIFLLAVVFQSRFFVWIFIFARYVPRPNSHYIFFCLISVTLTSGWKRGCAWYAVYFSTPIKVLWWHCSYRKKPPFCLKPFFFDFFLSLSWIFYSKLSKKKKIAKKNSLFSHLD